MAIPFVLDAQSNDKENGCRTTHEQQALELVILHKQLSALFIAFLLRNYRQHKNVNHSCGR